MRVVSLGSGSSGNALLVQSGTTAVLVDAGFAARTLERRLAQVGVAASAIRAVLLTHEHTDHACGARAFAQRYGIPLVADARTLNAVVEKPTPMAAATAPLREEMPVGGTLQFEGLEITSFPVPHDAVAPCGYLIASSAWRVCLLTDAGMVPEPALELLRTAQLLVLEANHDRQRLLAGPYPEHLKRRILGPTGHLSNEQTGHALARILDDGPRWLWLAHLSRTNNTPDLARAFVKEQLRHLGLRHILPQPLPREVGPVWDSAALWSTDDAAREAVAPVPVRAAAPDLH